MISPTLSVKRAMLALLASGLASLIGCADNSGVAKRYAVSGTVNYNGKPVEKGTITFAPGGTEGRVASGEIVGGSYSLTTVDPGDGAIPGAYKVTVAAKETDTTELKAIAKGGQFHHDGAFAKAVKTAKPLVPPKYQLVETSGLTAEVKAQSNSIPFELKD